MRSRYTAILVLCGLLAGCGGGDPAISAEDLPKLVLRPDDLPKSFVSLQSGRQTRADQFPGAQSDPNRFGREDGWKVRFQPRRATPSTRGPIQIESRADVFEGDGGAKKDFEAYRSRLSQVLADSGDVAEVLHPSGIGDEATGITFRQPGSSTNIIRYYAIAWRQGNVTALMIVNGINGRLFPAEALALARKQARRIAAAADGGS